DKLFANQRKLKRADLEKYAQELGMDMTMFKQALDSGKFKARVDAELREGGRVGVSGTPSFYVNDRPIKSPS
ncbi:MAG TPA: thioredoxin, partial [Myxococcales bacterium]|nr:thioredoxin [Myxococcales bacterium]